VNDSSHLSSSSSDACQKNKKNFKSTSPRFLFSVPALVKIPGDLSPQMGMYLHGKSSTKRKEEGGKNTSTGCKIDIVNRKRILDGECDP